MIQERYVPTERITKLPDVSQFGNTTFYRVTVETGDDALEDGIQLFSASVVGGDGSRPGEVIVVNTGFLDGPHTKMQATRNELYAQTTGCDVLCIGIPGMATGDFQLIDGQKRLNESQAAQYGLTDEQSRALAKEGDFGPLGKSAWQAVQKTADLNGLNLADRTIHFLNYSAGVSTGSGMLQFATEYAENPGIILNLEGAAYEQTTVRERIAAFTSNDEQEANKLYEANNPLWVPKTTDFRSLRRLVGNVSLHPFVHYRLGKAFAHGKSTEQLLIGLSELDIASSSLNLVLGNCDAGQVSTVAANHGSALKVQKAVQVKKDQIGRVVWADQYHGFCNDLGAYILAVKKILG